MPSEKPVIAVRTDPEIVKEIKKIAKNNNRSVSKEIELLIKNYLKEINENEKIK